MNVTLEQQKLPLQKGLGYGTFISVIDDIAENPHTEPLGANRSLT